LIARLHREANQAKTVELEQGTSLLDDLAIAAQRLWQAVTGVKKVAIPVAFSLLIIIVASFSASNFLSPSPALASGCTLSILSGSVEVQVPERNGKQGADGMTLDIGTRVRTASDASALLTFFDGSTLKLEPGTDIEIQQLKYDEEKAITIVLKQWMGRTWSRVEKMADAGSHYEIETPSACAVVRGTLFTTEVDATGATTVATTQGLVSVVAQGEEVYLPASQQTHVESGAAPSQSFTSPLPTAEIIINIDAPAIGSVIDPTGASTGLLQGGLSINQISGSRSLLSPEGNQVITIPQPQSGEYTIALRYLTDGAAHFNVQGTSDGDVAFEYAGDYEGLNENGWLIHINVRVDNGRIIDSQVIEVGPLGVEGPEKVVKTESVKGRIVSVEPIGQNGDEKSGQDNGAGPSRDAAQSQGNSDQSQGNSNQGKGIGDQSQGNNNQVQSSDQGQTNDLSQGKIDQIQGNNQGKGIDVQSQGNDLSQGKIDREQGNNNQGQVNSGQSQVISDQSQSNSDQSQSKGNNDQSQGNGNGDQSQGKGNSDQSQGKGNNDQSQGNGNGDKDKGNSDQSQGKGNSDQSQGNGNGDKDKGNSDQSQGNGNSDQSQGNGSSDQGQANSDQSQGNSNSDQGQVNSDQGQGNGNSDQGQVNSDRSQGQGNSDQGNGNSDQGQGNSDQSQSNSDQSQGNSDQSQGQGNNDQSQGNSDYDTWVKNMFHILGQRGDKK
jgi:hypothetical protein